MSGIPIRLPGSVTSKEIRSLWRPLVKPKIKAQRKIAARLRAIQLNISMKQFAPLPYKKQPTLPYTSPMAQHVHTTNVKLTEEDFEKPTPDQFPLVRARVKELLKLGLPKNAIESFVHTEFTRQLDKKSAALKAKIIKEEVALGVRLYQEEQKMLSAPTKSAVPELPSRTATKTAAKSDKSAQPSEVDLAIKEGIAMVHGQLNAQLPKRFTPATLPAGQEEWDIFTLPELPKSVQQQEERWRQQQEKQPQQNQQSSSLPTEQHEDDFDDDEVEDDGDDEIEMKGGKYKHKNKNNNKGSSSWGDLEGLALSPERVAEIEAQHAAMMAAKAAAEPAVAPTSPARPQKKTPLPFEGIQRGGSQKKKLAMKLTPKRVESTSSSKKKSSSSSRRK